MLVGVHQLDGNNCCGKCSCRIKDVGDYEIVGGVPAKFIKKRFTDEEIKSLKEIKWWDRDETWVRDNISKFWSVGEFVESLKSNTPE